MSCNNVIDSSSEPYIDGLLVRSDPSYPSLELFCANPILSPPSDPELSTYSCDNHLLEAFDYSLLVPCSDQSSPKPSINHRKRCASIDLADEFSQSDCWRINDEISANLQDQVEMINGDILQDYLLIVDDYAPNTAVSSANYDCSDLEDVLDFLLKESETASTQSVMPCLENLLSLREVDWKCDFNDSTNQAEADGGPSCGFHNIEKEKEDGGENRARWQGKQAGEFRTSWQQIQGGEVRASWQQKQGTGETRASWQPASEQGRYREGAHSPQLQDVGPRGSSTAVWAGPTLMDIESALATRGSPGTHHNGSIAISSDSSTTASSTVLGETDQQEKVTSFLDVRKLLTADELPMCKKELLEKDNLGVSWRLKLQKRNHLEPKHSVKVRREEGAAGDGYRWRKYGQKNIKNSPFPRSYYKCTNAKCSAKKQVERCHEDDELLLVTYEGVHLHHRPNPISLIVGMPVEHENEKNKRSLLTCCPSSPMCASISILPPSIVPSFLKHCTESPLPHPPSLQLTQIK